VEKKNAIEKCIIVVYVNPLKFDFQSHIEIGKFIFFIFKHITLRIYFTKKVGWASVTVWAYGNDLLKVEKNINIIYTALG